MDDRDVVHLKMRYFVWLYKTTKEAFDKYERKFTQLEIDEKILAEIERELKGSYLPREKEALEKFTNGFRDYICKKETESLKVKYKGKKIDPEFLFLDAKLQAIEKVIAETLGQESLSAIKESYQQEMVRRILEERQHTT